jgi:hypothetical protein
LERYKLIDDTPNISFTDSAGPDPNARIPLHEFFHQARGEVRKFNLDKVEALIGVKFGTGLLSEDWNAVLDLRPQTILVDGLYFGWVRTTLTDTPTLHLLYWGLDEDGLCLRKIFLKVGNRTGKWATLENEELVGGGIVHFNQEVGIDPDFKQIQQKDLDMVRAICEAGGKMKVVHKSGAQGVIWTSISKMAKKEEERENFVHDVFAYWEGM